MNISESTLERMMREGVLGEKPTQAEAFLAWTGNIIYGNALFVGEELPFIFSDGSKIRGYDDNGIYFEESE